MLILIFFAFLAGIVTILSPCILPVLPIVLSGTLTGGKQRPLGIILGFIGSFTFFTLFLSTLVKITGIGSDVLRQTSVIIVFVFGISLLLPIFQVWMEKLFSGLTGGVANNKTTPRSDLIAGLIVGVSLGLVWAPCVGPILASVIALALTGTVTASAFFITLAYSLGTAIPMLAITYGGRSLLGRAPWLMSNAGRIQKGFGVLMIATAIALMFNLDRTFQTYILRIFPSYGTGLTKLEDNTLVQTALNALSTKKPEPNVIGKPINDMVEDTMNAAPNFIPGGQWFNSKPLSMSDLRGNVVFVDFWTYTCINCIRTLPYVRAWWDRYKDKGLVIVGIHTPEFEFEKDSSNLAKAINDFALTYPVMQDNNYATWNAYGNHYWPAHYLIDKKGRIRYTHFGEGEYDRTESMIQQLLKENGATINTTPDNPEYTIASQSPETYLGYKRIAFFSSPEQIKPNTAMAFTTPVDLPPQTVAYSGIWTVGPQYAMPAEGATLKLQFNAERVFLGMRPTKPGSSVRVLLDGSPQKTVNVEEDKLYTIIERTNGGNHILELDFINGGVELYAFTFG